MNSKSNHPYQHKLAAYHSMINRLINTPMSTADYNKEYNIIKQIAYNNGYDPKLIDKLISKRLFNKTLQEIYSVIKDTTIQKFKSITYLGENQAKLTKLLRKQNINMAYKTNNNLAKYIKNNKGKTNHSNKWGVYKLTCGTCTKGYIGQTGRAFKTRIADHYSAYINRKNDSTYANHLIDNNHSFNIDFDILHVENKSLKLDLLETLEINKYKNSDNLLNDKVDLNSSPLLNIFSQTDATYRDRVRIAVDNDYILLKHTVRNLDIPLEMGVYCAVYGCVGSRESKHRFPNPIKYPELFKRWILSCGRPELLERAAMNVYGNCRVCRKHFGDDSFGRNNVLLKTAYPTLYLPEPCELTISQPPDKNGSIINNISTNAGIVIGESTSTVKQSNSESIGEELCMPSTSRDTFIPTPKAPSNSESIGEELCMPSTSRDTFIPTPKAPSVKKNILTAIGINKVNKLSPKSKFLYTKACSYRKKLSALSRAHKKLKAKNRLKKPLVDETLQLTSKLDRVRARFFQSQLENIKRKSTGRRYMIDDKVLALALQKQCGSGYRLLSNIFDLPTKGILQRMLNKVDIKPGLNSAVLELFKAAKLKTTLDKYCILMFDEISITPHLQYNAKEDMVEGFEDFGYRSTTKIADHIQVFMLRGIRSKWKQPLYYNAVTGATKAADIVRILKLIVAEVEKTGFHIVATICDQGSNNVAAITSLIAQTRRRNLKNQIDSTDSIFQIGNTRIIPLYDTPHLIKGIRNNLLKHDLCFEINSQKKIAKWDHIYTAYKMDSYIGNIRTMPKLTEYHVNPSTIKKMKVSYCSQVFSHSVAQAINLMAFSDDTEWPDYSASCSEYEPNSKSEDSSDADNVAPIVSSKKKPIKL
ncbi:thap domain-containing protein 9 [Holotrichia oblita]|uniref:Thap domain-containing protein 9 n=1 Tax=Holotrichia oblita TaxID=644536 RepID=A0ACB9TMI6_HOLOL|nr:thap domain-containing protein 9 [Holotrichia oblita]